MKASFHTHSDFCDGSASIEIMAQTAISSGYNVLGFSSHAPFPFPANWGMKYENILKYKNSIRSLSSSLKEQIKLLLGLEIDYICGIREPKDADFNRLDLDYRIGSVHCVTTVDGELFFVDENEKDFKLHMKRWYPDNARQMIEEYWNNIRKMVVCSGFDIIGHLDVIRKNNFNNVYFDPDSGWYRDAAMATVEEIAKTDMVVEINTGGMARYKISEPYPASWLLKELYYRKIPVTFGADAHAPEQLNGWFEFAADYIKNAGYREYTVFGEQGTKTIVLL